MQEILFLKENLLYANYSLIWFHLIRIILISDFQSDVFVIRKILEKWKKVYV